MSVANTYSSQWFKLFLETQRFTSSELEFLKKQLPNPPYTRLLDLGCAQGRHANPLAAAGYEVVGIDTNEDALSKARAAAPENATYVQKDMRVLAGLGGRFDAVLSLWQSFGYFGEQTNREVIEQVKGALEPGGRFILDIFNRKFYERNQGTVETERDGSRVRITNEVTGRRLTSQIRYANGKSETFDWELFSSEEVKQMTGEHGFECLGVYTWFSEDALISEETPRLQYVLRLQK